MLWQIGVYLKLLNTILDYFINKKKKKKKNNNNNNNTHTKN